MDLHGNDRRNVQTTTNGHPRKKLTHTAFKEPWILSGQTNKQNVATCVETYLINIGRG